MVPVYRHSGRVSPGGLLSLPPWLGVAAAMGAAYQYVSMWSPLIYASVALVFGAAAMLYVLADRMVLAGRWRNPPRHF